MQHERMLEDIVHNPGTRGTYRDIPWETRRPYGTYLCGYLLISISDQETLDALNDIAHGGLTSGLGFDCAHYTDYAPMRSAFIIYSGTYKDHDFVVNCLKEMIDCILDR